jgi:hypothetical protein
MTRTATNKDLDVMTWGLAIVIAFFVLLVIVSATSLSDAGIAGWMAGLSTGTRVALAAFFDA